MIEQYIYRFKYACQSLSLKPGLVANLVLTIGLTLGALICALTLVYLMLFKALPYPDQEQLHLIENHWQNESNQVAAIGFSHEQAEYLYLQQDSKLQISLTYRVGDIISSHELQPTINSTYVSANWFSLMGLSLQLGAVFTDDISLDDAQPQVVISDNLWRNTFAATNDILEQSIEIRGVSYRIIGVASADYIDPEISHTGRQTDIWLPWHFNWSKQMGWASWRSVDGAIRVVAKKTAQTSGPYVEQVISAQLNDIWREQVLEVPQLNNWHIQLSKKPLADAIFGEQAQLIYYLLFGCLGVFIISIANTANLLLSRTAEQAKNLSICVALGATRARLGQQILTELIVITALTLPVALLSAMLGFKTLRYFLAELLPRATELELSTFGLAAALTILVFICSFFSWVCRSTIDYRSLRNTISASGKGTGAQIKKSVRQALIASQIAIALVIVFANSLLFNESVQAITEPMGFELDNTWQLRLSPRNPTTSKGAQTANELRQIKAKLAQHPAVNDVSLSLSPLIWMGSFPVTDAKTNQQYSPQTKFIDENYFSILEQPLIAGDDFSEADILDRERVVIVNDVFAKQLEPSGDVLGRVLEYWGRKHTIIGVVKGIKRPTESTISARRYTPDRGQRANFIINVKPGINLSEQEVIAQINQENYNYNVYSFKPLSADRTRLLFIKYTTLVTTLVLTVLTIFLAGLGLYGVLSYSSQMRKFEIGTRMAIGAKGRDIILMIFRDNVGAILVGTMASLTILFCLYLILPSTIVSYINLTILPMYLLALLVIVLLSFIACYLPVRQYINKPVSHSLKGSE